MKKLTIIALLLTVAILTPQGNANAQAIPALSVLKAAAKKVIKAMDLKVQRLQNKTIWLQNTQKTLENALSKLKLKEIGDWSEKQKDQYKKYYDELAKVKSIISNYQRIAEITKKQMRLVNEYNKSWTILRQDGHFTAEEIEYMGKVYGGILEESLQNINQITLIVKSFSTKIDDAKRLELINNAADQIDSNYDDLMRFNKQNLLLTLQRSKSKQEVDVIKKLYGIIE